MGLPVLPAVVRRVERVRVHHRKLLLSSAPLLRCALIVVAACGEPNKSPPSAKPEPAPSSTASAVGSAPDESIVISPTGVRGAKPLVGAPEACTAFHACCDEAAKKPTEGLGLACSLALAAGGGKCEEALKMVRDVIAEQNMPAPPGCLPPKP